MCVLLDLHGAGTSAGCSMRERDVSREMPSVAQTKTRTSAKVKFSNSYLCRLHAGNGASLEQLELLAEARGDGRVEDRPSEGAVVELHLSVPDLLCTINSCLGDEMVGVFL